MSDLAPPKLFLDAALIVAALSATDPASPGQPLFKMGEVGLIHLFTSERVTGRVQDVLQKLTGEGCGTVKVLLAEILVLANVVIHVAIRPDCEVFVTEEEQHRLRDRETGLPDTQIVVMTGGEALEWAVAQVQVRARRRFEAKRAKRL